MTSACVYIVYDSYSFQSSRFKPNPALHHLNPSMTGTENEGEKRKEKEKVKEKKKVWFHGWIYDVVTSPRSTLLIDGNSPHQHQHQQMSTRLQSISHVSYHP